MMAVFCQDGFSEMNKVTIGDYISIIDNYTGAFAKFPFIIERSKNVKSFEHHACIKIEHSTLLCILLKLLISFADMLEQYLLMLA